MSELSLWSSGSVPERRLTRDEREVILKHLYDRACLQAQDEKVRMTVDLLVGQTVDADARVENVVTTIVERQDAITHPEAQGFMRRSRARTLMHLDANVQGLLSSSAESMNDIVWEPYTRAPIERPFTLREFFRGRTDG